MRRSLSVCFLTLASVLGIATSALATDGSQPADMIVPGDTVDLNEFKWIKRPLIVFADSASDPRFIEQMKYITEDMTELENRDVIVLVDTDADVRSDLRLALRPRGFMIALVGKDGGVKLRKPSPWNVREISRTIDKMPIRQQEMRDRRSGS